MAPSPIQAYRTNHTYPQKPNPSRETVPLRSYNDQKIRLRYSSEPSNNIISSPQVSYCSMACLDDDQSDHVLECARMPRLTPLSDLARLLARLCLKAADQTRNDVHSCGFQEVGGPPISSANRKSANLFDIRNICKCCNLRTIYFFRFADPII
jgi:hypothetical protein